MLDICVCIFCLGSKAINLKLLYEKSIISKKEKTISTLVLINRGAHFQRNAFDPNIDGSNKFPKYQIFLKYRFFPGMNVPFT